MAETQAKAATTAKAPAKGRSLRTKLVLLVVLLVGIGAGYVLKGGGGAEDAAGATATTVPDEPGLMVTIEPLSINLADDHFLRVGIAVQLVDGAEGVPAAPEEWLAEHGPIVRDLLISRLGGVYVADLADAPAREAVRDELLHLANEHFDDTVYAVYFTDFVMQ
jgi:flagellar FliL protein